MTMSIDHDARAKTLRGDGAEAVIDHGRSRLALFVGWGAGVLATVGALCMAWAFTTEEWRVALLGTTLLLLAGMGGTVLCLRRFLADRQEFYQRGQLDGWMRGWRGQEPEVFDPLMR